MKHQKNTLLEQVLRSAMVLKRFDLNSLLVTLGNANKETVKAYLITLKLNGNIKKLNGDNYVYLNSKPVQTRIKGNKKAVLKSMNALVEFNNSTLYKKANTDIETVKTTIAELVKKDLLEVIPYQSKGQRERYKYKIKGELNEKQ